MNNPICSYRDRFNDIVRQFQGFAIFVRGKEFQEASIKSLEELFGECTTHKNCAIAEQIEDDANAYLAFECMAKALIEEFRFYLALKRDDPGAAWDHLINAQYAATNAMKSHSVASHLDGYNDRIHEFGHQGLDELNLEFGGYIGRLHMLEKLLFPQPMFFSSGLIMKESECSICGSEYGECDHVKGRPYMGKLCARIIKKYEIQEVSPVSNPASKHARALCYTDENGIMRDFFTRRIVSSGDAHEIHGEELEFDKAMPDCSTMS